MRILITRANIVQIIISNIAHTVYIRVSAFWNFSKLQFSLHILAFTKFQLRWWAPWYPWWTLFKSSFPTLGTQCISEFQRFQTFRNSSLFYTFCLLRNFFSGDAHDANYGEHCLNHHFRHWAHVVYYIYIVFFLALSKFLLLWCAAC